MKGIPDYVSAKVCPKCMTANIDLHQIPDESISVFVGRVVRTDRDKYERMVQIQTSYPQNMAGKILRFPFSHSIRKGDKVAVAGQPSADFIEPILVRNMSAKSEKLGRYPKSVCVGMYGRKILEIDSPIVSKAHMQINTALRLYEEEAAKVVTPSPEPHKVDASGFEALVADLFERLGFQSVMIVGGAGDKGIDIEASRVERNSGKLSRIIVQCKHQDILNRVMPTQVRDFAHTIEREKKEGVQRGYFVTSSYFSSECFDKENCGDDMELIDRDQLEVLLRKAGLPIPELR